MGKIDTEGSDLCVTESYLLSKIDTEMIAVISCANEIVSIRFMLLF